MRFPTQEGHESVGVCPEEATNKIRELLHLSYEDRLRELGLFIVEEIRFQEGLRAGFQYLKEADRKDGKGLYNDVYM